MSKSNLVNYTEVIPFSIDKALDCIDMEFRDYAPSKDALEFFVLIRIFFGEDFEVPNPKFHYFIVDMLYGNVGRDDFPYSDEICETITINPTRIGIIATRGSAKSTVTTLFYPIVCAIRGTTPVTGPMSHMLILSDSQQGGARDQALIMGNSFEKSEFASEWFEKVRFTEREVELVRAGDGSIESRHMLIKFKGAQANPLTHRLFTPTGRVTIGDVSIGDRIFGADGKLTTVVNKSEVFHKPMYRLVLKDGRTLDVSDNHINSILFKENNYKNGSAYTEKNVTTLEMLDLPMWHVNKLTGCSTPRLWIENCAPIQYEQEAVDVDPYTMGLVLGDGTIRKGVDTSVRLTGSPEDIEFYKTQIPYEVGVSSVDSRNTNVHTITIMGIGSMMAIKGLQVTSPYKFIPEEYFYLSVPNRLSLLQGLIDTDGTIAKGNKGARFMTTSIKLRNDVMRLVRSLGGIATTSISNYADDNVQVCGTECSRNYDVHRVYIRLNMQVCRLPRKVDKLSYSQRDSKVAIVAINPIPTVPSQCIEVDNKDHQYVVEDYVRTHNTGGIRSGSRNPVTGDRYAIIIADDVIKNEAEAYSDTIMHNVKTALNSDALNAMRAKNTQLVLINTPFHKKDPIYISVESGVFTPLVAPICKKIYKNMPPAEFEPLWEEMHDYGSVMGRYINAVGGGSERSFNQELMLRIADEGSKLIKEGQIKWISRGLLEKQIDNYNIYITTDYTASNSKKGDYSGTAVWAVSNGGDWFLLDLSLKKLGISEQYEPLFHMVQKWGSTYGRQVTVGIEIDGQQQLNIHVLKKMMIEKNTYFTVARQVGQPFGSEGISRRKAGGKKHEQFMRVHPLFQQGKIFFCEELRDSPDMVELLEELGYITWEAITSSHDDGLDCQVAGSLVLMADGTHKAIETIVAGDRVKTVSCTMKGYAKAKDAIITGKKEVMDYTLSTGDVLSMTDNHLVLTTDGYVFACDLLPEHKIIQDASWKKQLINTEENGHSLQVEGTLAPSKSRVDRGTYRSSRIGYTQEFGVTAKTMCTISTTTKPTIVSTISYCSPNKITCKNISRNSVNGVRAKRTFNEVRMPTYWQITHSRLSTKRYVKSVARNGRQLRPMQSTVQRNAGRQITRLALKQSKEITERSSSSQNVLYAEKRYSRLQAKVKHAVKSVRVSYYQKWKEQKAAAYASTAGRRSSQENRQPGSATNGVPNEQVKTKQRIQCVPMKDVQRVCTSKITHPELKHVQKNVNAKLDESIVKYAIENLGTKYNTVSLVRKDNRRKETTYNFEVPETNNYMMYSGIVLHNCISMIPHMEVVLPSKITATAVKTKTHQMWGFEDDYEEEPDGYSGY